MGFVFPKTVSIAIQRDRGIQCNVEFDDETIPGAMVHVLYRETPIVSVSRAHIGRAEDILHFLPHRLSERTASLTARCNLIKQYDTSNAEEQQEVLNALHMKLQSVRDDVVRCIFKMNDIELARCKQSLHRQVRSG